MNELKAREIFAAGVHNGDPYSVEDLDEMVRAFNELDFKPALKAGHNERAGELALGWVTNLWRDGTKLLADFSNIPDDVFSLIQKKAFDRVSAEVFWNFERAGKTFKRALKAVALLGAEIPAVAGLKPLSADFGDQHTAKAYTASLEPHSSKGDEMDPKELQAKIDAAAKKAADEAAERTRKELEAKFKAEADEREKKYAQERAAEQARIAALEAQRVADAIDASVKRCNVPALHAHLKVFATLAFAQTGDAAAKKYALGNGSDGKPVEATAKEALDALVTEINTKGARLFAVVSKNGERKGEAEYDPADRQSVDAEVDKRVKALKAKEAKLSIAQAQDRVFAEDADLAKAYADVHRMAA